jgi:hypothetical protein
VGSVLVLCGRPVVVAGFVLDQLEHCEAGVPTFGIAPASYPLEDGVGKFGSCFPGAGVKESRVAVFPGGDSIIELS